MKLNLRLRMKKTVCTVICAMMLVGVSVPVSFAEERQITRGDAVSLILQEATDYNENITKEDIIKGYANGSIEEDKALNRIEAYVMLARAFGQLDAPKGNNLRTGVFNATFSDVPFWAIKELKPLTEAGLITEQRKGEIGAKDTVSEADVELMLERIYNYTGSDIKDNFYAGMNKEWLDASVIPQGNLKITNFAILEKQNDEKIKEIILGAVKTQGEKGSIEQKISDFYSTAMDIKSRNEQGIEPVRKYIDLIDKSKDIDELMRVDATLDQETGTCTLLPFNVGTDIKNSQKSIMEYYGYLLQTDKEVYMTEDEELTKALKKMIADFLVLSGESKSESVKWADDIYETEKDLSKYVFDIQEMYDVNKIYNVCSRKEFTDLFTGFDMDQTLTAFGLEGATKVNIVNKELTMKAAQLFADENLELCKAIMKCRLMQTVSPFLSEEVAGVMDAFQRVYMGKQGESSSEEKAIDLAANYFSEPIEQIYAQRYFNESAKTDIERMIDEFVGVYKEQIKNNEWLSEDTKKMAIKKLEKMNIKVGYPDKWPGFADKVEIKNYEDGGNLFENATRISALTNESLKKNVEGDVDREEWGMPVYRVNAYYMPTANEIVFPAGILQSPFYDENASEEANLGGIGLVIAHEITHAFDSWGANYDENGNAKNWWTDADRNSFNEKCKQVVEFYEGEEIVPGIVNSGDLTVNENIADLGGFSCVLAVAAKNKSPNYDELFGSFSKIFLTSGTRTLVQYEAKIDVHSNGRVRTNQTVKNFEEFYKTYNIKEGDAMYLAPEERIDIW